MSEKRRKPERQGAAGQGPSGQSPSGQPDSSKGATPPAPGRDNAHDDRDSSASSAPSAEEEQEQVEHDLSDLLADVERERDEYLELARRTKADFENYRKRVAGETHEAERRGRATLARELLPVLDNLERALAAAQPADGGGTLAEGVRLVFDELARVLERSGIESYEPTGEPFDPHLHEAMMTRPVAGADAGKVLEVLEKGYRLDGQVLRPARVVVGSADETVGAPAENRSARKPPTASKQKPSAGKPADGSQAV